MPKFKTLVLLVLAVSACVVNAQSPTQSHLTKVSYVNTYFNFAYTWPAMLAPSPLPASNTGSVNPHTYEFPLFIAREGGQPFGVVVVAQKLNVAGPHSAPIMTSKDLVDRIARSLQPGPILSNIARSEKKGPRGIVFDELSYSQSGKPSSIMATQIRGYAVLFKCNARTAAEFDALEHSVLALQMLK